MGDIGDFDFLLITVKRVKGQLLVCDIVLHLGYAVSSI
jgi:hypothetical protein